MTERYSRQVLFSGIGERGQEAIRKAKATVIGVGALGTVAAEMLVRAGIGSLRLVDRDFVEESNLQRQALFQEEDARRAIPKAVAAEAALKKINSDVRVEGRVLDVDFENIESLCRNADLVVDGSDNFEVRFLMNDLAVRENKPWIYGAVLGSYGIVMPIVPGETPCLSCLFPEPFAAARAETCDTVGVLAPAVHMVASCQVAQALKILVGEKPARRIFHFDVWGDEFRTVEMGNARRGDCLCCVQRRFRYLEGDGAHRLTRLCGRNAVQIHPPSPLRLDLKETAGRLSGVTQVDRNPYMLRFAVNGFEVALFEDGRAIIRGTEDFHQARAVYSRFIGS